MKRLKLLSMIGRALGLDNTVIAVLFPGKGVGIKFYAGDRDSLLMVTGIILSLSEKIEGMPEILRGIADKMDRESGADPETEGKDAEDREA